MTDKEYYEFVRPYRDAMQMLLTRLDVLNHSLYETSVSQPVHNIQERIKEKASLEEKLARKGKEPTVMNAKDYLKDIAGIRVICYFLDDIYDVARWLSSQDDIRLLQVKDYIKNPKPNGYRSLHLIVEVPVFFSKGRQMMRVEVQIRTIAMDFWASLEHQLSYKKDVPHSEEIGAELKECAEVISHTDQRMQEIREKIGIFTELT